MYLHEPVYDIKELTQSNYHIHTSLSRCGKAEMTLQNIIAAAEKAGLREIALTDHIHPGETWKLKRNLPLLRETLDASPRTVSVLLGAELSAYGEDKYTLRDSEKLPGYSLYAHNHYHMFGWEQPEDDSPFGYKEHCKKVMTAVIKSGKADCMAHPFNDYYIVREFGETKGFRLGDIAGLWTENELGDMLTLGKEHGVAWEINAVSCRQAPELVRKYWHIGKEVGACFLFGTDAHVLSNIYPADEISGIIRLLSD